MKLKSKYIFFLTTGILLIFLGIIINKNTKEDVVYNVPEPSIAVTSIKKVPELISGTTGIIVKEVLDGDTIVTNSGEKIRYIGINTPEKGQPFAKEATEFNKNLVLNKEIKLEYDIQKKDRYGRTLAYVYTNGVFVNLEIIKNGLAVLETIQPNVKYQDEFVNAQKTARAECLGLWKGLCEENSSDVLSSQSDKCVKITSITADASGDDNKNKNGEWIEFKNNCQEEISMSGWLLKDSSASNEYRFDEFILEAGKNVIIYSGCGEDTKEKLYWQCPERKYAVWNNSTDHAFLYNERGELVSDYQY